MSHLNKASLSHEHWEMESVTDCFCGEAGQTGSFLPWQNFTWFWTALLEKGGLRAFHTDFLKLIQTSHICQRCDSKDLSRHHVWWRLQKMTEKNLAGCLRQPEVGANHPKDFCCIFYVYVGPPKNTSCHLELPIVGNHDFARPVTVRLS